MKTEMKTNKYEQAARARKVKALVDYLLSLGVDRDKALAYDTIAIESLSAEAGVKPPSAFAWSQVLDKLAERASEPTGPTLFDRPKPRRPFWEVDEIVHMIEPYLTGVRHEWGGSYRRRAETVGDLDLIVITDGPLSESGLTGPLALDRPELVQFSRDVDLLDDTAIQVDVWRCLPDEIGPFMAFVTGPKEWNVLCRSRAIERKWKLSQHGLVNDTGKRLDDNTEESIFRKLGLPALTPEQRQNWRQHVA